MGYMSKDRVRFKISGSKLFSSSKENRGYVQLCREIFGLELPCGSGHLVTDQITIICRPSQFARFLIRRNERGLQNSFQELKPELFKPEPQPKELVYDVSCEPAR